MEDLFYILLIIAWVAYGIYSAAKKNSAKNINPSQTTSATPSAQAKDPVESILESLFQGTSPAPVPDPIPYSIENDYEEMEQIEEEVYVEEEYLDVVPEPEYQSQIDIYSNADNVEPAITLFSDDDDFIGRSAISEKNIDDDSRATSFDLRAAVIAKAILDRPYK